MADVSFHSIANRLFHKSPRTALAVNASVTEVSFTLQCNAKLGYVLLEVPNYTNAITVTLEIIDANSKVICTKGSLAKNTSHIIDEDDDWDKILVGQYTVKLTLSGAAGGAGGTAYCTIFAE